MKFYIKNPSLKFRLVVQWLAVMLFLGIIVLNYVEITPANQSDEGKKFLQPVVRSTPKYTAPVLILNTKGCKIKEKNSRNKGNLTINSVHVNEELVTKNNCYDESLTFVNPQKNLILKAQDSMTYRNLNCCASYWTSSSSYRRRTECKRINNSDSMLEKEFILVNCCFKWWNVLSECQTDLHAVVPLTDAVQRKVQFWGKNISRFPPNVIFVRLKYPKLSSNFMDVNKLSQLQFVPMNSFMHRGNRNSYPFYTKVKGKVGKFVNEMTKTNEKAMNSKADKTKSNGKKSLIKLFSSFNKYVTFNVMNNRRLAKTNALKFDYNFANFLQGSKTDCIGNLSIHKFALKYISSLIETFPTTPFFGSVIFKVDDEGSKKSKDSMVGFLETLLHHRDNGFMERTLIILMEDPDVHVKSPSQLFIRMHTSFLEIGSDDNLKILNVNKHRLLTSSDLHQTLIGVFELGCHSRRFNQTGYKEKCSSEIQQIPKSYDLWNSVIPDNRNCTTAGISKYFCPCFV